MSQIDLIHTDCVAAMRKLADKSVDHTLTDPPYSAKTHSKGRRIVADFSDPGDLICDPFAGGGTTAVTCQELGRDCITFECDEDTYNKSQHRIKEAGKQQPLFAPKAAQATQLQLGG